MPAGQFCEVRYEELVKDPMGQMRAVYERLGLGDFEVVRPAIQGYMQRTKDYKTNRHELPAETRDEITRRWAAFIQRYGYAPPAEKGSVEAASSASRPRPSSVPSCETFSVLRSRMRTVADKCLRSHERVAAPLHRYVGGEVAGFVHAGKHLAKDRTARPSSGTYRCGIWARIEWEHW